ncbi:hypothetical protein [Cryptosporangium sp. NPDC048952]|uniref:hypothetical protein n=1 Tax=Cryptosporangium sp. NPDC048952 TaxID=3363961 RepID=UPI00371F8427
MPLAGRRRELGAIARFLDRAGGHLVLTGPAGAGKTALAEEAVVMAAARGLSVARTAGAEASLLVLDDFDPADAGALASLASGGRAVLVTAAVPLGVPPELHLGGLAEPDLAVLLPTLSAAAVHAVWLATGGVPGPALDLAATLDGSGPDAVLRAALATPSRAGFLELDPGLIRLLRAADGWSLSAGLRARVSSRLARQLLADASAAGRRRELADEALGLARRSGDPGTIAAVLDDRLHALWDPAAAEERLAVAAEIVEQACRAGDALAELRGLFWRFTALVELADLEAAEATLIAYERIAELAGDVEAPVVVLSRQAMFALIRGRFDVAEDLIAHVRERGRAAGLPDTERLVATLTGRLALLRGTPGANIELLRALAQRLPGHFFEATIASVLVESGAEDEAAEELARLLPSVLAGTGPRWLGAVADLGIVAARVGEPAAAKALYDTLLPYRGRLVVWGGANTITGPVDDVLGRLAARLGRTTESEKHFDHAIAVEERFGALPWLATTRAARSQLNATPSEMRGAHDTPGGGLPAPTDEWALTRDGTDWVLRAGTETARLRDTRGVAYLRALLAAPGQEIAALDLAADGAGLRVPNADPVLDDTARRTYRARLATLDDELAAADRAGDADAARAATAERQAIIAELRRTIGLGGRPRTTTGEAERARVNTTRALRTTIARIAAQAPLAGAHLDASIRTGRYSRYQPGSVGWKL